jgi:hypothetical protein
MKLKFIILSYFLLLTSDFFSCQCPLTKLSLEECDKYEIIFRGRIKSLKPCEHKKSSAVFEVTELYKGAVPSEFLVLIDCEAECAQVLSVGEEWIIYTNYKQAVNAQLNWCSRSRKYFKNEKLDFYTVTYGNTYDDELIFLREKLGVHRIGSPQQQKPDWAGNQLPTQAEFIIYLLISIAGVVGFIYLVKRFLK